MYKKSVSFLMAVLLAMLMCSCYIQSDYPKSGIYYCEELNISIDFASFAKYGAESAILHAQDGSCKGVRFLMDYGAGMLFQDGEDCTDFFDGEFVWNKKKDVFQVEERSTGKVYCFFPVSAADFECCHHEVEYAPYLFGDDDPGNQA